MKKTQVALAAVALLASTAALADGVSVSGIMDVGVGHYTGNKTFMEQGGWADHSSITFSATEDLSNGVAGFVTLEAGFDANGYASNGGNGNLFSRQALVGLKSAELGSISAGQQLSPYILAQALTNQGVGNFWVNRVIMGGGGGNAAAGGTHGGFFMKDAVEYISPNIAGFQLYALTTTGRGADAGYVAADGTANNGGGLLTANTRYTSVAINGQVAGANLWVATQDMKDTFKSWTIGGSYALTEQLTVSANYIDHKDEGATKVKSYALGATYKVAPATSLVAQYARNNLDDAQTLWNLGAKYDFSKRTAAYITYGRATNGAISTIGDRNSYTNDGSVTTSNSATVVGITHAF